MHKRTRNGSTTAQITATLREEIIAGILPPKARLRQQALAARFQASRMPVRESLQILAREGLVTWPTGRSARVAPLDPAELREISEMRMIAESLALRLSVPAMSDHDLAHARSLHADAREADSRQFAALNSAFHQAILAPCNRPRLLAHIEELGKLSQRYLMVAVNDLGYAPRSHDEHSRILAACKARDADQACRLLERHITAASTALLAHLTPLAD